MRRRPPGSPTAARLGLEVCEPRWQLSGAAVFGADLPTSEPFAVAAPLNGPVPLADLLAAFPVDVATAPLEFVVSFQASAPNIPLFLVTPLAGGGTFGAAAGDTPGLVDDSGEAFTLVGNAPTIQVFGQPSAAPAGVANARVERLFSFGDEPAREPSTLDAPTRLEAVFAPPADSPTDRGTPTIDDAFAEVFDSLDRAAEQTGSLATVLLEAGRPHASGAPPSAPGAGLEGDEPAKENTRDHAFAAGSGPSPAGGRQLDAEHASLGQFPVAHAVAAEDLMSDDLRALASRVVQQLHLSGPIEDTPRMAPASSWAVAEELIHAAAERLPSSAAASDSADRAGVGEPIGRTHGIDVFDVFDVVLSGDRLVAKIETAKSDGGKQVLLSAAVAVAFGFSLNHVRKTRGKAARRPVLRPALCEDETRPAVVERIL